jgi:hypothetical protein
MTTDATARSARQVAAVVPVLTGAGRFAAMCGGAALPARTLFHAGPPFADRTEIPAPILNSAAVAAVVEGWARDVAQGKAAVASGDIALAPAQDHGVVVPLAFVAGPSTGVLLVSDGAGTGSALAAINDGPPDGALRFGAPNAKALDRAKRLGDVVAPALDRALRSDPVPLAPIAADALRQGDELHGQVAASSTAILRILEPRLGGDPAAADVTAANQFFLNVWMAACALMLKAGAGVPGSRLICAAGGNGRRLGLKLAGDPDRWMTREAAISQGPRLSPALAAAPPLPAVGDSVVIDACGFGAQALGFAPALRAAFGDAVPPGVERAPAELLCAISPVFGDLGIRVGLDLDKVGRTPFCANLAIVDRDGAHGLLGRGIATLIAG